VKWEHYELIIETGTDSDYDDSLREMGQAGWQAYQVTTHETRPYKTYYLKREVDE